MTDIVTTSRIAAHLEKYVYDRVWNQPYAESRSYTKPELLSDVPVAGIFPGRYDRILLPPFNSEDDVGTWLPKTAAKFYLYAIPDRFFSATQLDVISEWTLLSDFCTAKRTDIHVFTESGVWLNRGAIYIRQAKNNDCILMAVGADMLAKLAGTPAAAAAWAKTVVFGKYVETDQEADNKIYSHVITAAEAAIKKSPSAVYPWEGATYLLYNGKFVDGDYRDQIREGSWVEAVTDDDVVGSFTVDCSPLVIPSYTSINKGVEKEKVIVHIPKDMNKELYLITANTCDIWMVPHEDTTKGVAKSVAGVYLHPCGRREYFTQLTHNDFAIDKAFLDEIAEANGFGENYSLKVFVRYGENKQVVVRDVNYIDMLYNLGDDEILMLMCGLHPWQQGITGTEVAEFIPGTTLYWYKSDSTEDLFPYHALPGTDSKEKFNRLKAKYEHLYVRPSEALLFWKADNLEKSKYADALIRRHDIKAQDPANQCAWCNNDKLCTQEQKDAVATVSCQRFSKKWPCQCYVCGHSGNCSEESRHTEACPYYNVRSIRDYVEILGYFHVLSLVGKRVWHFRVTKAGVNNIVVYAPLALSYPELDPTDFFPVVYHNGIRIAQDRISVSKTTTDNDGLVEMNHSNTVLSRSTLVIQANYGTRLKITIAPEYEVTTDYSAAEGEEYFVLDENGEYVVAVVKTEAELLEMSPEERPSVTYVVGEPINKDKEKEWTFVSSDSQYTSQGRYYNAGKEPLVAGTDYEVGTVVGSDAVLTYTPVLYKVKKEVQLNDVLAVEVFDKRGSNFIRWFTGGTDAEPTVIKTLTVDQWEVYEVTADSSDIFGTSWKYERVPDPGIFDDGSKTLTIYSSLRGKTLILREGPSTVETSFDLDIQQDTLKYVGSTFQDPEAPSIAEGDDPMQLGSFPLSDSVIFVNGLRLSQGLDYTPTLFGYSNADTVHVDGVVYEYKPFIQNLSYLWNGKPSTQTAMTARVDVIRSNTELISSQYGFMVGRTITWTGHAPFWFNELSTLTVDGVFCSHFYCTLGSVTTTDKDHRNGAPYEIKTSCSSRVMDIVGCRDAQDEDMKKILEIRSFFEAGEFVPIMQAIIPHSHKIYSLYLNAIVEAYLGTDFDFFKVGEITTKKVGSLPSGTVVTKETFEQQFTAFLQYKKLDTAYRLSEYDLGFVDVYPTYHRVTTQWREDYAKLMHMNQMLSPVDNIKHKDAIHE